MDLEKELRWVDRDELMGLSIDTLRDLKRELHWALQVKENESKVVVWEVEEYTGVEKRFVIFENALSYVMSKTEEWYRKGFKEYTEQGMPSYISFEGYGPRIRTKLILPAELETDYWSVEDLQESKEKN